jgi:hypothetical protein
MFAVSVEALRGMFHIIVTTHFLCIIHHLHHTRRLTHLSLMTVAAEQR